MYKLWSLVFALILSYIADAVMPSLVGEFLGVLGSQSSTGK